MSSVTVITYLPDNIVRLEATVAVAGVLTNPTTSTFKVEDPSGTVTPYTIANGGMTNPTTGTFRHDHDITGAVEGEYWYSFKGTGAAQVYEEGRFYVRARQVV